jgi:hypothetical protein
MNPQYQAKLDACKLCFDLLDADIYQLVSRYDGEYFPDSKINKGELFRNIMINGSYTAAQETYMESMCGGLTRFRDRRTGVEYATDLVIGWISEDGLLDYFLNTGQTAVLSGDDRYREFLNPRKISTQADIELSSARGKRKLEYMNDWTNTWKKRNHLDLRENKYLRLVDEKAIFLGISPLSQEALVIDIGNEKTKTNWVRIDSHWPYGGKPAWQLKNPKALMMPIDESFKKIVDILMLPG